MAKPAVKAAPEAAAPSKVSRGVVAKEEGEEKAERARKYDPSLKIKVLSKENPHREGTGRAEAFNAVVASKTMGDYYETGHKVKYIQTWIDSKHIEVG